MRHLLLLLVGGRYRGGGGWRRSASLLGVVDEVTSGPVGAEAGSVESAAEVRLVFRVAAQIAQLVVAVGKLALVAVFAGAGFLEGPAQLGLVMRGDGSGRRLGRVAAAAAAAGFHGGNGRAGGQRRRRGARGGDHHLGRGSGRRERRQGRQRRRRHRRRSTPLKTGSGGGAKGVGVEIERRHRRMAGCGAQPEGRTGWREVHEDRGRRLHGESVIL